MEESEYMIWFCLMIFFVRIVDVSLGTIRMIFIVKGRKIISALIAFAEALIWFLIVKEALNYMNGSIWIALSYAAGFASGTFVGGYLSELFIPGKLTLQVFVKYDKKHIIQEIRNNGYAVTAIEYDGIESDKKNYMLYINIDKKKERELKKLIQSLDKDTFFIVNEAKNVINGYFK